MAESKAPLASPRSSIARLPAEIRTYIETKLADGRMTLDELIADLKSQFPEQAEALPSRSAVGRYGQKLNQRLAAIRASTEAAKIIRDQAGDREDARSEALTALIQSELFESIMHLQEAGDMEPDERIGLLSAAAKNIATLSRSSVNLKRYQEDVAKAAKEELLAEQKAKLDELQQSGEVDQDVLNKVIKAAYGL